MLPPHFIGDPRHRPNFNPHPDWFTRDMGERIHEITPKRIWRFPIWPGFRLELKLIPVKGVEHV
ncbi:MAG: hypothetical protein COB08_012445 [Rhodobacteraceae bacterium]|nr:hypothetical protein [Paracoccaceae bacterium]